MADRAKIWRPRYEVRGQKVRKDGRSAWAFGCRVGYWPCMRAPFVRFDFGTRLINLWVGWDARLGPLEKCTQ